MARVYDSTLFEGADTLDVHRVDAELANFVGEMNGRMDRDNIPPGQEFLPGKVAKTTFNEKLALQLDDGATNVFLTLGEGNKRWQTLLTGTLNTDDGRVAVEAQLTCTFRLEELGVFLDGQIVARSGPAGASSAGRSTVKAIGCPPVGPGAHIFTLRARWQGTPEVLGSLFVRHMRR